MAEIKQGQVMIPHCLLAKYAEFKMRRADYPPHPMIVDDPPITLTCIEGGRVVRVKIGMDHKIIADECKRDLAEKLGKCEYYHEINNNQH